MHHLQRKILRKLPFAKSLGYAQLRPEGVESNHFSYHLEQLVKAGVVAKVDHKYSLTTEGLALADRVNHDKVTERLQPQIITSVQITNDKGQLLAFKHTFQPYLNLYGFPQGRLHTEDDNIENAAKRELREKTGLEQIPLTHRGIVYVTATKDGAEVSRLLIHVFSGSIQDAPELPPATKNGECAWLDVTQLKPNQCMPGFLAMQKLAAEQNDLFFAEITEELATSD